MISTGILNALRTIIEHLNNEDIRWAVMASTSLALQGVDITPNDVDILTDEHGAFKIGSLLKDYEVKPVSFGRTNLFESFYGIFNIDGTKVEVMGDLKELLSGTWVSISGRLKSPILIRLDTLTIPVTSLHDELISYEKLGREKDKECILRIREALR